ncbi:hypothetical protein Cgig2_009047 [Carnegiea gigantea]|uniref:Reverse transcriptase zinc-binding domain-containing protein n=1 Tax=Carnegiea gigantea TaxID=171969 RepID=A0A9Q1GV53_9CARY|nr:hypothetical protein Cgig2_009047 [Carnegiea gigantea]
MEAWNYANIAKLMSTGIGGNSARLKRCSSEGALQIRNGTGGSPNGQYKVKSGYLYYLNPSDKATRARLTWSSLTIPRQCFIAWVLMRNRIPVRTRLAKFRNITAQYQICQEDDETQEHLFYQYRGIRDVWKNIYGRNGWLNITPNQTGQEWM